MMMASGNVNDQSQVAMLNQMQLAQMQQMQKMQPSA
jgi:hypothetical protein